jgi:hypothetical protein
VEVLSFVIQVLVTLTSFLLLVFLAVLHVIEN